MVGPDLLTDLLKSVSRSFYLTLRVLPGGVRSQIGLAYLLARATDTIADTELVPVAERLAALGELRARILRQSGARLDFQRFTRADNATAQSKAERVLLERIEEAITVLASFSAEDQQRIREVLDTITSGQELDLRRFGGTPKPMEGAIPTVLALASDSELDDYTYRVAGCVGEFWTKMCRAHLFPRAALDDSFLLSSGVRFGKGLQLVNVLRDLPKDLRLGRCYLPSARLAELNLAPSNLLDPSNERRLRPLYDRYLDLASEHLAAGWAYTKALPRGCVRVRLACAWPVLIGVRKLARLRAGNVLDPAHRIKVSRAEVRQIMLRSLLRYPCASAWDRQFSDAGKL